VARDLSARGTFKGDAPFRWRWPPGQNDLVHRLLAYANTRGYSALRTQDFMRFSQRGDALAVVHPAIYTGLPV